MIKGARDLGLRACAPPVATKEVCNRPYVVSALQIWDTTKKCTQYSGITVIKFRVFNCIFYILLLLQVQCNNCKLESTLLHCTMNGKILVHVTVKKL